MSRAQPDIRIAGSPRRLVSDVGASLRRYLPTTRIVADPAAILEAEQNGDFLVYVDLDEQGHMLQWVTEALQRPGAGRVEAMLAYQRDGEARRLSTIRPQARRAELVLDGEEPPELVAQKIAYAYTHRRDGGAVATTDTRPAVETGSVDDEPQESADELLRRYTDRFSPRRARIEAARLRRRAQVTELREHLERRSDHRRPLMCR